MAGQTGTLALAVPRYADRGAAAGEDRARSTRSPRWRATCRRRSGSHVSFAYIVNLPPPKLITGRRRRLGDELGGILFQYPETPDVAVLGPKSG